MSEQLADNNMANLVCGLKRWQIGGVLADALPGEALPCGKAARLAVEVTYRAQHQNTLQIHAARVGQKLERLQGSRVFHRRSRKLAFAAGKVSHPFRGPCVHELAVPIG